MVEKVALEPFVKAVPEETIPQQKLSNEPVREHMHLFIEDSNTGAGKTSLMFKVPKGHVFEVITVGLQAFAKVAPVSAVLFKIFTAQVTTPNSFYDLTTLLLDHAEHGSICCSFPPLSFFINEENQIRQGYANGANALHQWNVQVTGNLIKKDELFKKTNIII